MDVEDDSSGRGSIGGGDMDGASEGGETIGVGGGGTSDATTEGEANRKQRNKKRKNNEEYLPRKKKCPAVHGRDNKEMWCKPCIQSKKCTKYI